MSDASLTQFFNCKILRNHHIVKEDLWVRDGKIIDPEKIFFDEKVEASNKFDCNGKLIAPGFIELQINGGFGHDFSYNIENLEEGLNLVSHQLLGHGVTAYCPTLVTSPREIYHKVIPKIKKKQGGKHGATVLGIHLEGPFINLEKKGAHPSSYIRELKHATSNTSEFECLAVKDDLQLTARGIRTVIKYLGSESVVP